MTITYGTNGGLSVFFSGFPNNWRSGEEASNRDICKKRGPAFQNHIPRLPLLPSIPLFLFPLFQQPAGNG
jgi:hypothetical protein